MAMKKKIAVGIGAVLVTAMCFGGSVFAESTPVNGSGDSGSAEGSTNATVTYTKGSDSNPSWSVNIPKSVDFGKVNAATPSAVQSLDYTAYIEDPTKIASLKVSLSGGPAFDMVDNGHTTPFKATNAFSLYNQADTQIGADGVIADLKDKETKSVSAKLNVGIIKSIADLPEGDHAFTGQFGVKIDPVKATS